jgi:hypothetical protein
MGQGGNPFTPTRRRPRRVDVRERDQSVGFPPAARTGRWLSPPARSSYEVGVYTPPKKLDEEVARLHLEKIGAKLTTLSPKPADYIGVAVEGPYKPRRIDIS